MSILELEVEQSPGRSRIVLRGELDIASAGRVDEEVTRLLSSDDSELVLDLRELSFMDSTGLRAIVRAHEAAQGAGKRMAIVRGPEAVNRVFQMVGLEDRLDLVDDAA